MSASYDLNAIADALAGVWQSMNTHTVDGTMIPLSVYSEVPGVVNVPALAIELDDIAWDQSMGRGADQISFLAYLIVSQADSVDAQRLLRQALSTAGLANKLKDKLVASQSLGGLVSYAHMPGTRSVGVINYGGVDYQGATLEIVVMS